MNHVTAEVAAWIALATMAVGLVVMLWVTRREDRGPVTLTAGLHAHPGLVHAHADGEAPHVHDFEGDRVAISS